MSTMYGEARCAYCGLRWAASSDDQYCPRCDAIGCISWLTDDEEKINVPLARTRFIRGFFGGCLLAIVCWAAWHLLILLLGPAPF